MWIHSLAGFRNTVWLKYFLIHSNYMQNDIFKIKKKSLLV